MKTALIAVVFVFLVVGCESPRRTAALTAAQAQSLAVELANNKADALFHHRPFDERRPAQLEAGRWVWADMRGVGMMDIQARVELAADGSTNSVDVRAHDSALRAMRFMVPRRDF